MHIFTFLDTETTGLDYKKHEILEFASLTARRNTDSSFTVLSTCEFKIKPERIDLAEPTALKVNGYTEEAWQDSLPFNHHADKLLQIINDSDYLVGQNLIFDLRFIRHAFFDRGLEPPVFPQYFDTQRMGKNLLSEGKLKSASLDGMCNHFDIKSEGRAHTALVDVKRTFELYVKLSKLTSQELFSYVNPHDPYKNKKSS
jgi:DNA polymerase-3 subunit epsilon